MSTFSCVLTHDKTLPIILFFDYLKDEYGLSQYIACNGFSALRCGTIHLLVPHSCHFSGCVPFFQALKNSDYCFSAGLDMGTSNITRKKKNGTAAYIWSRIRRRSLNFIRNNNKEPLYMIATQTHYGDGTQSSVRTIRRYLNYN